ncbi:FAD-dependent oxidoreductase [Pantanalinema sp. GBBB05]|uniref:FAD-dependent oxidoreductase n=1 Tax=Pantanalinema sp. GBBB05 TaxID=2604139 RepID=UPI001D219F29|nr:NAD(P)/FAD-dependent oxidoreductase [Pantanalinema sp. GBBB05]
MAADYNLVIIGNTAAGIEAAIAAARLQARVALVEQRVSGCDRLDAMAQATLVEAGRLTAELQRAKQLGIGNVGEVNPATAEPWQHLQRWLDAVQATTELTNSAAELAALGVDVIPGCGEFCRKPTPGFVVNGRFLSANAYLIAVHHRPIVPDIPGLAEVGYLTATTISQHVSTLQSMQQLVIIGGSATAIELTQSLAQLGCQVTLIVESDQILAELDPQAATWLQASLEAAGVKVLTRTRVTQIRQIQGKKWLQAGNHGIETDEILIAIGQQPELDNLNLDAVGVKRSPTDLVVNAKQRTSHPKIYACTGQMRQSDCPHRAIHEARIALKNALFLPIFTADELSIPLLVNADPELAAIGLTEPAAIQRYGKAVLILQESFNSIPKAQIQANLTGFCKLIVHRNGRILGAHIVGSQASEMIGPIALAMQQNLPIQALAKLNLPTWTRSEIIGKTAAQWHDLRLKQQPRWQDFLQAWFQWRR